MTQHVGTGIITRPDIYAGTGYNPFTGIKNDFRNVTSWIPSQGPTKTGRTEFDTNNRAVVAQGSDIYNNDTFRTTYGGVNPNQGLLDIIKMMGGSGFGSGSGSGASDKLARDQFNYGKQQDALTRAEALEALQFGRARDARSMSGLENYYGGGQGPFNQGFENLLGMITDQGKVSQQGVTDAYGRAITGVNEGYNAAAGLGASGFNALNQYLQANPNNPYAGMTAQVGSAPDALSQYLSAYGVSDVPVQGQIQADKLQAQQGAGNFQNLVDVLSGVAQQGASSRSAEAQMAELLFGTSLGQDRAGYRSQAENAQAQALAALQQAMAQSRFSVEQDRNSLANQLAQSIITSGGNYEAAPVETQPPVEVETQTPVVPTFNTDIANMPAAEQRAALDRIESYTPETFAQDSTEEERKALQQLLANMGLG
jgi:uncharacterized coiled-coil protein SlyX